MLVGELLVLETCIRDVQFESRRVIGCANWYILGFTHLLQENVRA